jgi:FtsH-binding integral membrane protein
MYGNTNQITIAQARQEASSIFLAKVFNWMAMGLGLTGFIAYFTASSGLARAIVGSPLFFIFQPGSARFRRRRPRGCLSAIRSSTA